jgi:hypothetical protein
MRKKVDKGPKRPSPVGLVRESNARMKSDNLFDVYGRARAGDK